MLRRLHDGTTAQFLVNGELSDPMEVLTGIRQGCPLAPLLFILAAEILALAIKQDSQAQGIKIPGGKGERHEFSAFVDDSTVFLSQAQQIPRVMEIVEAFGRISGLKVQPTKSHLIFLNTAIAVEQYAGIPVLAHGETVRYLGYDVGTGALENINWANRIRAIQRRLATATKVATSVDNRVTILNVIMLPSLLFTAAVFDMPTWAATQLRNLQKQFLWHSGTGTGASRHKVTPGLVFTPRQAGGMGLASIQLACKTQRVKHAMLWLLQKKDRYFNPWKEWMFRGDVFERTEALSPRQQLGRQMNQKKRTPGDQLRQLMGEWIRFKDTTSGDQIERYQRDLEELELEAISWTVKEEWLIELPRELPQPRREMTEEEVRFWPTFSWCNNPGIVDQDGKVLQASKYEKISVCTLEELHITRTGSTTYSMRIPTAGEAGHQQAKLRRWGLAILLNAPRLPIRGTLEVSSTIKFRHQMELEHDYTWKVTEAGEVVGTVTQAAGGTSANIALEQQSNGIHWKVCAERGDTQLTAGDVTKLQKFQQSGSIVFYAHPWCHGIPWVVPDNIANKHVIAVLKKQPFIRLHGEVVQLDKVIDGLQ
jgi:hypothetical protein